MKTCVTSSRLVSTVFFLATICTSACVPTKNINSSGTASQPATNSKTASFAPETDSRVDSTAMLTVHNQWRAKVGVPALRWSAQLADMAQQWADQLAASGCQYSHSGRSQYGENIFFASPVTWSSGRTEMQQVTPKKVTADWGNEGRQYDYATNYCSGSCGHYTQLVWRDTKEVDCGMAVCDNNAQLWVCNYFPVGNVMDQRPY